MTAAQQRLQALDRHLLPSPVVSSVARHSSPAAGGTAASPPPPRRKRVLVCAFTQEIASMNPVPSTVADFSRRWGEDVGIPAEARSVFKDAHCELVT
jgi:hypothetical protein